MPQKKGAGDRPQEFDRQTGRYGNGEREQVEKMVESVRRYSDTPDDDLTAMGLSSGKPTPGAHRVIPIGKSKEQFVAEELGVDKQKAKEYVDAIYIYTVGSYSAIRKYQQGGEGSPRIRKAERDIEDYIAKAPSWNGGETFRGVGMTDEELSRYTVGSVHDMSGTSSWSSDPVIAEDFADWEGNQKEKGKTNAVIFHSPTQSKGTSIRHLSRYNGIDVDNESEVLVSKQSKYKVVRIDKDKYGRTHIYLEEHNE